MLEKRLLPQSLRFYIKRLKGVLSHLSCYDIDSPFVSQKAQLGKGVKIGYNTTIEDNVKIDGYTYIENDSTVVCASIGKYCSIGRYCQIGGWEHPYRYLSMSPVLYRRILDATKTEYTDDPEEVFIGNDVWIGSGAIILGGVTIGDGCIIAAGAIVTKDVPAFSLSAGVPAKVIKYRFTLEEQEIIKKLEWWNWTEEKIKKNRQLFCSGIDWSNNIIKNNIVD